MHFELDDKIYRDHRFMKLIMAVGDPHRALGLCISAWVLSFEYWKNGKKPIPRGAWGASGLGEEMIEVGLARYVDGGDAVYVCGSEEKHAWYLISVENGRKGGLKSRRKISTPPQPPLEPDQPSYSSSFSSPFTSTGTSPGSEGGAAAPPARARVKAPPSPMNLATWEAYAEAYRQRYGTDPVRNVTVNGQIAQLVKRLGKEAPEVVRFYLDQNRAFYLQSCHPVGLCLKDAEALRTQWVNNTHLLPTQARQLEQRAHNSDVWDRAAQALAARREEKKS